MNEFGGPHNYYSADLPASRGQQATIASLALQLLGEQPPTTRYAASVVIVRLRAALDAQGGGTRAAGTT